MPTVLIVPEAMRERADHAYVQIFRDAGFEIRYPNNPLLARGLGGDTELISELEGVDAVVAGGESYTEHVLQQRPSLRVIARAGVGYDQVDVPAATSHGVPVTITPKSNHEAVAELTMALMFAFAKSIVRNDKRVRSGEWPRELLRAIRQTTFGVIGLGRIGRSTAIRAAALGAAVIAVEQYPDDAFIQQHGIELVELDELAARSDFVSVHCPLNDETRGMFDRAFFSRMKSTGVFINTARGQLVNEPDLYECLTEGVIAGAALDVLAQEPPEPSNPLFALDNVVLSPHLAGTDHLSLEGMGVECANNIVSLHRGDWPQGAVVNDPLRDGWTWSC